MATKQQRLLAKIGKTPDLMEPMGNYITVQLFEGEDRTTGGILLTHEQQQRQKPMVGKVIRVGKGLRSNVSGEYLNPNVKPGDFVILLRYAAVEVKLAGETFHVISELDILGRITAEDFEGLKSQVESEGEDEKVIEENDVTRATERPSGLILVENK